MLYYVEIMVLGEMLSGYDYYPLLDLDIGVLREMLSGYSYYALLCGEYGVGRNAVRISFIILN